jgi:hypothetical protein
MTDAKDREIITPYRLCDDAKNTMADKTHGRCDTKRKMYVLCGSGHPVTLKILHQ